MSKVHPVMLVSGTSKHKNSGIFFSKVILPIRSKKSITQSTRVSVGTTIQAIFSKVIYLSNLYNYILHPILIDLGWMGIECLGF